MFEYFLAVQRVPEWLPTAFTAKVGKAYFRYFRWYFDFNKRQHLDECTTVLVKLAHMERENQVKCHAALDKLQVLPVIEEFCDRRPERAMPPDYVDLYYLHSHILETRPRVVLELGSGVSSVVMAAALKRNGEGQLYSVDPIQEWAESTVQCLPSELKDWCEVTYSDGVPIRTSERDRTRFRTSRDSTRFKTLPVEHADMIYLDAAHKGTVFKGAETVHAMRKHFKGGETILIDGRWSAIEFFGSRAELYDVMAYGNIVVLGNGGIGTFGGMDLFTNAIVTVRGPSSD